ncbi:MAG: glutaredoxin family protein, partial [Candidatus Dormiibacterota bacterium]
PLCESAHDLLIELASARGLAVSQYDIDEDALLRLQFTDRVPVIRYRGRVLAEGRVAPDALRAALDEIATNQGVDPDDPATAAASRPGGG